VGYEAGPDGVEVRLGDGRRIAGSGLIGADGIRSAVRARLLEDGEPLYAGYVSWRGVTPEGFQPAIQDLSESWGPGRRFGIVPIERGRVYWAATSPGSPGPPSYGFSRVGTRRSGLSWKRRPRRPSCAMTSSTGCRSGGGERGE
jgi:hypothetical protein